jgi:hypothetical protein
MSYKLPNDTKDYLLFMIENRIENNPQDSVFKNKKCYEQLYILEQPEDKKLEPPQGGMGSGQKRKNPKDKSPGFTEILMGDEDEDKQYKDKTEVDKTKKEEDEDTDNPLYKLLGAAGVSLLGGAAKAGGDYVAGALGKVAGTGLGGKALKYGAQGIASLAKQAEEISGKTWIEAQLGKIGQSQMELAAQGAGSPWTKFVIPEKKPTKVLSSKETYDKETQDLASRMKGEEIRNRARQQGLIP